MFNTTFTIKMPYLIGKSDGKAKQCVSDLLSIWGFFCFVFQIVVIGMWTFLWWVEKIKSHCKVMKPHLIVTLLYLPIGYIFFLS